MPDDSSLTTPLYCHVAVAAPIGIPLTYRLPGQMEPLAEPGVEVTVPLGKRVIRGYIIGVSRDTDVASPKDVIAITSGLKRFNREDLDFYRWAADYYHYSLGKALAEVIPEDIPPGKKGKLPAGSSAPSPPQRRSREGDLILNEQQTEALAAVSAAVLKGGFRSFLLHGVTGSGKTEIYLRAIEQTLQQQKGALFLVPEIALTPMLLARVRSYFPDEPIALFHSGIDRKARSRQWQEIIEGRIRIALGARSALFVPLINPGLIIIDEEHDFSYKQDGRFRYHARDLALVKGRLCGATVILGSATPDLQTYHNAVTGKYSLLSLPKRVLGRPLSPVSVIDLKKHGEKLPFSAPLAVAIRQNLAAGKQTMLFLNRRGFDNLIVCTGCGHVFRCRHCSVALTHHRPSGASQPGRLICHHCGYNREPGNECPDCNGTSLKRIGVGTEKVEEELTRMFPGAKIARMDRDTTRRRDSHRRLMDLFAAGEIDILVGTQMITKGHDFPGVTLIGVILADISLNLPDFRAAEKTWQLLTQVAGRAGRGDLPGQVIIQTFNPDHYSIQCAKNQQSEAFYRHESSLRKPLMYPPFARMVNLQLSARDQKAGSEGVEILAREARKLSEGSHIEVIGPAEAPLTVIKDRHRWQILLKGKDIANLHRLTREVTALAAKIPRIRAQVDVDPVSFM